MKDHYNHFTGDKKTPKICPDAAGFSHSKLGFELLFLFNKKQKTKKQKHLPLFLYHLFFFNPLLQFTALKD